MPLILGPLPFHYLSLITIDDNLKRTVYSFCARLLSSHSHLRSLWLAFSCQSWHWSCQQFPWFLFFFFYLFIYLFIYGCVGSSFLCEVAASGGHSSSRCTGPSLSRPLLLRSTGSRRAGSVVVAHGPSCSAACEIFPDQGSNPCPLHWQADSQPLCHQGSPPVISNYQIQLITFSLYFTFLWHLTSLTCCGHLSSVLVAQHWNPLPLRKFSISWGRLRYLSVSQMLDTCSLCVFSSPPSPAM